MLVDGFRLARQSNGIQLFLRYQAQAERLYRRAVEEVRAVEKAAAGAAQRTHFSGGSARPNAKKTHPLPRLSSLRQTNPFQPGFVPRLPPCRSQLGDPTNQTYGTTGSHTALDCSPEWKTV